MFNELNDCTILILDAPKCALFAADLNFLNLIRPLKKRLFDFGNYEGTS